MKERRRQPKKQTRDREVGGRLGARPKEVCVQSRDTMQDSTQGLRAVTAMRRCVCRGVCVQRSDTTRDSAQGLRAATDTRRCVCRGVCVQRSDTQRERALRA